MQEVQSVFHLQPLLSTTQQVKKWATKERYLKFFDRTVIPNKKKYLALIANIPRNTKQKFEFSWRTCSDGPLHEMRVDIDPLLEKFMKESNIKFHDFLLARDALRHFTARDFLKPVVARSFLHRALITDYKNLDKKLPKL